MTQSKPNNCPQCGKSIPDGTPASGCPHCLLALAMNHDANTPTTPNSNIFDDTHIPTVEKLVSEFPGLEIQHLIGHGGMGAVYQARQINLDRKVALKILSPRLGSDPAFAERFLREARTLAKLSHPNIVTVFDFGQAGEFYYLTMEFVDGVNLRDTISANLLKPAEALAIVPQVCEALQYAHDNGVIHRDIKPENILISKDGSIKIADFGLAKLLQPTPDQFTLTGTRQVLGTMNYMAPEQIERPDVVDHRADLYSLGVVFYELLTGELPLGRFSLPSEKSRGVSNQLDDVVMRTLEKDPDRRFQQASQIKTACQSVDKSEKHADAETASPHETEPVSLCRPFPVTIEEIYAGFATGYGLLRGFDTHLELEFEVRDFMDAIKSQAKTVQIPLERIANIKLSKGFFYNSIDIQTDQIDVVSDIPTSKHGAFKAYVKKDIIDVAEQLVQSVKEILGHTQVQSQGKPSAPVKTPHDDTHYQATNIEIAHLREQLRFPRFGMIMAGIACMLFGLAVSYCTLDSAMTKQLISDPPEAAFTIQQALTKLLDPLVNWENNFHVFMMIAVPVFVGIVIFATANRIRKLRDYSFVMPALILISLPIHPVFFLAAPFSIWLFVILFRSTPRRVFRANAIMASTSNSAFEVPASMHDNNKVLRAILLFLFLSASVFVAFMIIAGAIWLQSKRTVEPATVSDRPVAVEESADVRATTNSATATEQKLLSSEDSSASDKPTSTSPDAKADSGNNASATEANEKSKKPENGKALETKQNKNDASQE